MSLPFSLCCVDIAVVVYYLLFFIVLFFYLHFVMLLYGTIRTRLLGSDSGETVVYSRGYGGAGSLLCPHGTLGCWGR